ncbi:MAG TPA: hypothetical protein VM779_11640 [Thermoanaerobaculia bacterium]|nr:hypothetical protein [Thermoanaerobaculia bacterium]
MTIRCEQLDDLLLEGDAASMDAAAKHAESCAACREILADWNDIAVAARSMRHTWESDLLWGRIRRGVVRTPLWRIAAAALLTIGIGGTTWYAVRDTTRDAAFGQTILSVAAVDEVERAEAAYVAAIGRLEEVAEPRLENAEGALMMNYREKLMVLDDAIAEVRSGIAENRKNAHLRRELLAMYSEKQRTLQAIVREGEHVSNE